MTKITRRCDDNGGECTRCGEYKPWDSFYKLKAGKYGREAVCSTCKSEVAKSKRVVASAGREHLRIDATGRQCTACLGYFPWEMFSVDRNNPRGRKATCKTCSSAAHKEWRDENIDLARALTEDWVKRNIDKVQATAREYAKTKREALGLKEYSRREKAYRVANPEKIVLRTKLHYAKNKDKLLAKTRLDRARRPEAYAAYDAVKRAKRANGFCAWADQDAIKAIYALCKALSTAAGTPYHVDHIVPLVSKKVQGLHVETNLRIITGKDNLLKNNKFDPETFNPNDVPSLHWADIKEIKGDAVEYAISVFSKSLSTNDTTPFYDTTPQTI